jgi:plastocyanin
MLLGGFMVGAGLNLFEGEHAAAEGGENGGPGPGVIDPVSPHIVARDNFFAFDSLTLAADAEVTVEFENAGNTPHNLTLYTSQGGDVVGGTQNGNITNGGATSTFSFTSPAPVSGYYFQCDLHPDQMNGTLNFEAVAAGGGEGDGVEGTEGEGEAAE